MKGCITVFLMMASCLALNVRSSAAEKPIVAVFDVEDKGVGLTHQVLDRLSDYLSSLLSGRGYQVVPRSQLKVRLAEQKRDSYKICYDQTCQIEIGKELAAQKSISTQVIKLGSKCKITLTLFDLKKAANESGATASGGCNEDGIVDLLEKTVASLTQVADSSPSPPVNKSLPPALDGGRLESQVAGSKFLRENLNSPNGLLALYYLDQDGAGAMAASATYKSNDSGIFPVIGREVTVSIRDDSKKNLPGFSLGNRQYVMGEVGQRFTIVLHNYSQRRFECVVSMDGLDVIDGGPGAFSKRGYLLESDGSLEIPGFRHTSDTVTEFSFSPARRPGASGSAPANRNAGVFGFAIFAEQGAKAKTTP